MFVCISEWSYPEVAHSYKFIHMHSHANSMRVCTICINGEVFLHLCVGVCVCVCVRVGVGGWVCVFVCQINYLNPITIKAEICYQHLPLEARVSALLLQCSPYFHPLSGLSMGLDKDHKLWILNTHPSRTKTNSVRLWPRDSGACWKSSSQEHMNIFDGSSFNAKW